ncbi:MAG: hypothetical protein ACFFEF_06165 [Candidatus Thorarchaeota archaeon]
MKREKEPTPRLLQSSLDYENAKFPEVQFISITKKLSELSKYDMVSCPKCGNLVDFNGYLEWYGPHHFACSNCSCIIHFRSVRIMND